MKTLIILCCEFFKAGLFAIGGGLATLPFLVEMSANHPTWFSLTELTDIIAIAEATPGAIGINMATFAGYKTCGIPGGILATFSLALPSYLIILIISKLMDKFKSSNAVQSVFKALRPAAIGLICAAGYYVFKIALFTEDVSAGFLPFVQSINFRAAIVFAVVMFLTQFKYTKKLHPIAYIAIAAVCGIVFSI